jgi:hypothetical protein
MLRRKIIIPIVIVLAALVFSLLKVKILAEKYRDKHCLITQLSSRLFDLNTIQVKVFDDLKCNDFKIKNLNSRKYVFENGKNFKRMKNEYGHCRFEIYYKDTLIYELEHFKTNNWNTYDYLFLFEKVDDTINVTMNKTGNDSYGQVFYKQMVRDKTGKIYKIKYIDYNKKTYKEEFLNK